MSCGKFWGYRLVRVKQKLLLFGGRDDYGSWTDAVHEYDILNKIWTKLNVKLPASSFDFGCTPILNGKYIA